MAKSEKAQESASSESAEVKAIAQALATPFDVDEVKWKAQVVSGNRALAVAFGDARAIQDRLDDVMGVMGWQDSYECLPDGAVVCRLRIRLGAEWITKMDVGGQSEQPDEGDRRKAAFSDALKRAAVKFGIGRYLYRLPPQWVDYDPQKKQLVGEPVLPAPGAPAAKAKAKTAVQAPLTPSPSPPKWGRAEQAAGGVRLAAEQQAPAKEARQGRPAPANGAELQRRLYDYDAQLARKKLIQQGELVQHVVAAGERAGY